MCTEARGCVSLRDSYQALDLEALLVAKLNACDCGRLLREAGRSASAVDRAKVTDGSPAAAVEDLEAAKLCTAVCRGVAARQPQISLRCTAPRASVLTCTVPPADQSRGTGHAWAWDCMRRASLLHQWAGPLHLGTGLRTKGNPWKQLCCS